MFNPIEKYLKKKLDDIVFINLKDNKKIQIKGTVLDQSIPLPIPINEVVSRVKNTGEEDKDISIFKIIQGMIYILGIDSGFKYNEIYKNFLKSFDENIIKVILQQAFRLIEDNKKIDALICFKSCLYLEPNDIDSLYNYARCCEELSQEFSDEFIKDFEDEAIKCFENLTEIEPNFALPYYHLGFHYLNKKLYKKAQLIWEKSIEKGIDENKEAEVISRIAEISHKIQYEEGYNLVLTGRPNEALDKLLPLGEKYPEWWNLQFFIGLAYRHLSNFPEALKYLKKALIIRPKQVDILNEIGLCYISLRKTNEALEYFNKALSIKRNDPEILCNIGIAYLEAGEVKLASQYVNKSYEINPNDEITKAWKKKIESMD